MRKPKIGMAFFLNNWILELFSREDKDSKVLKARMEKDKKEIIDEFGKDFNLIISDYITNPEESKKASIDFLAEDVDSVMICFIGWGEDNLLMIPSASSRLYAVLRLRFDLCLLCGHL